jgi:hypothetical protein
MRLSTAAFAAVMATTASAFQLLPTQTRSNANSISMSQQSKMSVILQSSTAAEEAPPCATPDVIPESVTAKVLRSATLTDANGELVRLGDKMGKGTSIVVFLRHLG